MSAFQEYPITSWLNMNNFNMYEVQFWKQVYNITLRDTPWVYCNVYLPREYGFCFSSFNQSFSIS